MTAGESRARIQTRQWAGTCPGLGPEPELLGSLGLAPSPRATGRGPEARAAPPSLSAVTVTGITPSLSQNLQPA